MVQSKVISMDALDLLLDRLSSQLETGPLSTSFEVRKFSKNLEYAQINLLRHTKEDERDMIDDQRPQFDRIRQCQAKLAIRQEELDRIQATARQANAVVVQQSVRDPSDVPEHLSTQEHILQTHRETQESISDDLLTMAKALKVAQTKFGDSVLADNDLINRTGEALYKNSGRLKQTGMKLSNYTRQSSWSWMFTVLSIVIAIVAFVITVGLIRVT